MKIIQLDSRESNYLISDNDQMYTLQRTKDCNNIPHLTLKPVDPNKLENQIFDTTVMR